MPRTHGARNSDYLERRNELINKVKMRLSAKAGQAPSFRELAMAAGVSVATLRHYFGSREALVQAVFAAGLAGGEKHLRNTRNPTELPLRDSLSGFLQRVATGWTQGQVGLLHRVGLAEGLRDPGTGVAYLTDILEPTLQSLEERLAKHVARGQMRACDLRQAALALLAPLILALLHQHDLGGSRCRPLDIGELALAQVDMFCRAYATVDQA
ncbi:MAG: TetR/AcrR family transcriptional regulator [Steroidobacteraceae bacterium]